MGNAGATWRVAPALLFWCLGAWGLAGVVVHFVLLVGSPGVYERLRVAEFSDERLRAGELARGGEGVVELRFDALQESELVGGVHVGLPVGG